MSSTRRGLIGGACALPTLPLFGVRPAGAQRRSVRLSRQTSLAYLQFHVMERRQLLEKQARALGAGDVDVSWTTLNGANVLNDALISGRLDVATGGVAGLITIWARTAGTAQEIRGICTTQSGPLLMNTRRPDLQTIRDLKPADRIAVPAVKVAAQAVFLQMAAAKEWGFDNHTRFDAQTFSMAPADATAALLSNLADVPVVFTAPPFQEQQLRTPGVHTILNTFDLMGGPHSAGVIWGPASFRNRDPVVFKALLAALDEATAAIAADPRAAAADYVAAMNSSLSVDAVLATVTERSVSWTTVPVRTQPIADFMHRTGQARVQAASWRDYFFPDIHHLTGS